MRVLIPAVFLTLVGGAIFFSIRLGFWRPVALTVEEAGPWAFVSKQHMGPYHEILGTLEEVEKWVRAQGLTCTQTFGEFLDDPNVVEHERLRANTGCLLSPDLAKEPALASLPDGFSNREVPRRRYVVGSFTGSPALGPFKVYGPAASLMREKNLREDGPIIEVYTVKGDFEMTTTYYFPVR